jgi:hypothetical protein
MKHDLTKYLFEVFRKNVRSEPSEQLNTHIPALIIQKRDSGNNLFLIDPKSSLHLDEII